MCVVGGGGGGGGGAVLDQLSSFQARIRWSKLSHGTISYQLGKSLRLLLAVLCTNRYRGRDMVCSIHTGATHPLKPGQKGNQKTTTKNKTKTKNCQGYRKLLSLSNTSLLSLSLSSECVICLSVFLNPFSTNWDWRLLSVRKLYLIFTHLRAV